MYSLIKKPSLTPKEIEIVHLLCRGNSRKEIAYKLNIANGTVDTHLKHIFVKLNTRSMIETAIWGLENKAPSFPSPD